ncbi:hypothetical protein [Brucella sp. IR073]|uniref:hypothetical protein n=1 Tax=unclassified Brucella TaxID=2632610 RepID=UPI003B981D86
MCDTLPCNTERATPNHPLSHFLETEPAALALDLERLKVFSLAELHSLFNAVLLVSNTLQGIINQPRFRSGILYNRAGDAADELLEFLNKIRGLICNAAILAAPKTEAERRHQAIIIVKEEADCESEVQALAAVAQYFCGGEMQGSAA